LRGAVGLTDLTEEWIPDSRARKRARESQIEASVGCVGAPILLERVGGLIGRGRPATAPDLMRRFFLLPKLLISFSEIKNSNGGPANSAGISMHLDPPPSIFGDYFFRDQLAGNFPEKNVAKFPGGEGQP
jgi:hypothetical protein